MYICNLNTHAKYNYVSYYADVACTVALNPVDDALEVPTFPDTPSLDELVPDLRNVWKKGSLER